MSNIHATTVALGHKGILLLGASGSGKSDLALRLIEQLGAVLVADDRTDVFVSGDKLIASCQAQLRGLLEVRGLGIVSMPSTPEVEICLAVELSDSLTEIERMPSPAQWEHEGVKVKKIRVFPFSPSVVYLIRLACDENRQAG